MKTIKERAEEYAHSTLVGSPYIKKNAYIQGAKDVLKELSLTLSVSDDEHLEGNIMALWNELMGDERIEQEVINDNLEL
jgi:flagellin-specific chaperone FliS